MRSLLALQHSMNCSMENSVWMNGRMDTSVSETTFLSWFSITLALFRGIQSQGFCKTMVTAAESRQKPSGANQGSVVFLIAKCKEAEASRTARRTAAHDQAWLQWKCKIQSKANRNFELK